MKNPEIIIVVNTLLVSVLGVSLSVLSFLLKDVYRDYKRLSDQVHTLHREVSTHVRLFHELIQLTQKQTERNRQRMDQLLREKSRAAADLESD